MGESFILRGLIERLRDSIELRGRACQQSDIGLLVLRQCPAILLLKGSQPGVLVIKSGLGLLQLLGQELRCVLRLLLVEVQVLLHEHGSDPGANLLGDPRLSECDIHVKSRESLRSCSRHRVDRRHFDRLLQSIHECLHRHPLGISWV